MSKIKEGFLLGIGIFIAMNLMSMLATMAMLLGSVVLGMIFGGGMSM